MIIDKNIGSRVSFFQTICVMFLIFGVFLFETYGLAERHALSGWSPVEWTARVLHPENFASDFPNGAENYRHSSAMWIYPFFQKYFSIQALDLNYVIIYAEMLMTVSLFALLYLLLIKNEHKEIDHFYFFLLSILVLASNIRYANGARFSLPFWSGLYYVFADWFRILALIMVATDRRILAAILFVVAYSVHPATTLHALIFAFAFVIPDLKNIIKKRDTYVAFLILICGLGYWTYHSFGNSSLQSSQIPDEVWISLTKIMSFHWYPKSLGMFGSSAYNTIVPLASFLILSAYVLLSARDMKFSKNLKFGIISIILMVFGGWANSEFFQQISLIKISFQRSTDLMYFFFIPIILFRFLKSIVSANIVASSMAVGLIFSVFYSYGFPIIPVILFCLADLRSSDEKSYRKMFVFSSILFICALLNMHFPELFVFDSSVVGDIRFFFFYIISLLYFVCIERFRFNNKKLSYSVLTIVCLVLSYSWISKRVPSQSALENGRSYLEAQLWAKNNTPIEAVFFVDPTILYGWRDFSERSSFGNFREWLHTSWLYDSKYERYEEGMRRFNLLNVSLEKYLDKPIASSHDYLSYEIQESYYNLAPERLMQISKDNKISFVVMQKRFVRMDYKLKIAYQNRHYVVFDMLN